MALAVYLYYFRATTALESLVPTFEAKYQLASPHNRQWVSMAANVALSISEVARSADRLGLEGCESIEERANRFFWEFGDVSPRKARKEAPVFFQSLRDLTATLVDAFQDFDLIMILRAEDQDKNDQLFEAIAGIGRAVEYTTKC